MRFLSCCGMVCSLYVRCRGAGSGEGGRPPYRRLIRYRHPACYSGWNGGRCAAAADRCRIGVQRRLASGASRRDSSASAAVWRRAPAAVAAWRREPGAARTDWACALCFVHSAAAAAVRTDWAAGRGSDFSAAVPRRLAALQRRGARRDFARRLAAGSAALQRRPARRPCAFLFCVSA